LIPGVKWVTSSVCRAGRYGGEGGRLVILRDCGSRKIRDGRVGDDRGWRGGASPPGGVAGPAGPGVRRSGAAVAGGEVPPRASWAMLPARTAGRWPSGRGTAPRTRCNGCSTMPCGTNTRPWASCATSRSSTSPIWTRSLSGTRPGSPRRAPPRRGSPASLGAAPGRSPPRSPSGPAPTLAPGATPMSTPRLDLPPEWTTDPERCARAGGARTGCSRPSPSSGSTCGPRWTPPGCWRPGSPPRRSTAAIWACGRSARTVASDTCSRSPAPSPSC
jgi:hypothetical protein